MLDHSVVGPNGHHYSYALNVLGAAEAQGDEIVFATNRRFQSPADLPKSWRLLPVFTTDAYALMGRGKLGECAEAPLRSTLLRHWAVGPVWRCLQTALDFRSLSRTHRRKVHDRRRSLLEARWVLEEYARECEQVFETVGVESDDSVFIPTLTVFDIERLVACLRGQRKWRRTAWHLHFHFNLLEGRDPDYPGQEQSLEIVRAHCAAQFRQVPKHRIFFYTTTQRLAAQYERLGVGKFEALPYPVDENLRPEHVIRKSGGRLRVTYAGGLRPEKGCELLVSIVHGLWDNYFATDRLQLLIQVDKVVIQDFTVALPGGRTPAFVDCMAQADAADDPVVCLRAPLPTEEYARVIQSADIGLFLYQSERYYTRASGVLVEMLSAGIPVIVPAGCWLSAQIAEPIYSHLDSLTEELPVLARYCSAQLAWRRNFGSSGKSTGDAVPNSRAATSVSPSLQFGGSEYGVTGTLPVPESATDLAMTVAWPDSPPPGIYVRLISRQFDSAGNNVNSFATVFEQRAGNLPVPALIHLKAGAARIELTLENAFHPGTIELADVECRFVSAAGARCPAGAVGLIAADNSQLPELLANLTENYSHFRATAAEFGTQYRQNHLPARTVERIKLNQGLVPRVVAGSERQLRAA